MATKLFCPIYSLSKVHDDSNKLKIQIIWFILDPYFISFLDSFSYTHMYVLSVAQCLILVQGSCSRLLMNWWQSPCKLDTAKGSGGRAWHITVCLLAFVNLFQRSNSSVLVISV